MVEESSQIISEPSLVTFETIELSPPSRVYVGRKDEIYIRSRNSAAGVTLAVRLRHMLPGGEIKTTEQPHTPATDRSVSLETYALGEGFLLSAVVLVSAGTVRRGNCFVELGVIRGRGAAGSEAQALFSDYASSGQAIGWPPGRLKSSLEGPGLVRSVTGSNPAAGAEISEAVPTNARWKFLGASFQLVTAIAVANRQVHLLFDDGASVFFRTVSASVQPASLSHQYNAGQHGISSAAVATEHFLPTPADALLLQGYRIRTATDNLQVADDFGAPQLWIQEWLEE